MQRDFLNGCLCLTIVAGVLLGACGSDSDGGSDCYDGCESAADRATCVAACDGAADATGDDASQTDTSADDDTAQTDTGADDTTTGADTTVDEDTTIEPGDTTAEDADEDTTVQPTPELITLVDCYAVAVCYFQSEGIEAGTGEGCFDLSHPAENADARALVDCALDQCGDQIEFGSASVLACASGLCTDQYVACDEVASAAPGCGPVATCLDACDKRDQPCRNQCLLDAPDDTAAAVAAGYYSCVDGCYAAPSDQIPCIAQNCMALDNSCFGADEAWNCASVYSCLAACGGSEDCATACMATAADVRVNRAAFGLDACAAAAGCTTGDVELDALCTQESCPTLWNYCHP